MKPDFALLLSFDGIALLRRAEGGTAGHWYKLGDVSPETSNLPKALSALRESAAGLPGDPADVKLVLPTEQVRFLDIPAPAAGSSVEEAVESALDGATPYAIDDLVYDHELRDGRVHVAAVARETLEEAESFATAHGFHPLAFVSDIGPDAGFSREPFFGPTETALTSLAPGVKVQADPTPITLVPRPAPKPVKPVAAPKVAEQPEVAVAPEPEPKPEPKAEVKPEPKADAKPAPKAEVRPEAKPAPKAEEKPEPKAAPISDAKAEAPPAAKPAPKAATKPAPKAEAKPEAKAETKPEAKPEPKPASKPEPKAETKPEAKPGPKADPKPAPKPAPKAEAAPTPKPAPKPQPKPEAKPAAKAEAKPAPQPKAAAPKPAPTPEAPKPQPKPAAKPSAKAAPKAPAPKAPAAEPAAAPSFASIRAHRDTPAPRPTTNLSAVPGEMPGRRDAPAPAAPKPRDVSEDLAAKARASFSMRPKAKPDESPAPEAPPTIAASTAAPEASDKPIGFASRRKPRPAEAQADIRKPTFGKRKAKAAAAGSAVMDESERMTVFGARGQQKVGGKPRFLGLILTAVLLLLMLAVAAMASIFLDEGLAGFFRRTPEPQVAAVEAPVAAVAEPAAADETPPAVVEPLPETALALPDSGSEIDPQDPTAINLAALNSGVPALSRDLVEDQVDGLSVPFEAEALTPEQAEARYAATGIWQRAPLPPAEPGHNLVGDVYVASIDPAVAVGDAVAIPTSLEAQTDLVPPAQINPYPADAGLTFDDNGLILPTPEGVRHPAGFLLVQGPPPLKPPLRPGSERPVEAAQPVPESDADLDADAPRAADVTEPDEPVDSVATVVDETLAGLKPRPRPGDLEEQNERANLGGVSLAELRQKRPRPRPELERPAAAASLAQDTALEEDEDETAEIEASALAVAASPQPKTRPANIAALVTRATRNAEAETAARQTAAVQPRTVQPSIPSRSSVAAAATEKNAINLRKVNLIGVYGKPSSRRALVRLANGRYQKVKVGDRIDGGRVSAISDGQLSYVKSGRNIVLRMPRG